MALTHVGVNADAGADSDVSVDGNAVLATANGNEAANTVTVDAGTSITTESGFFGGYGSGLAYLELDLGFAEFGAALSNQGASVTSAQVNDGATAAFIGIDPFDSDCDTDPDGDKKR